MAANLEYPSRPLFHFTPPAGWMNDPNGLNYLDGQYHLFYQHNPHGLVWGPMHWGHAFSRNLVSWEHLPIAMYPDDTRFVFSASTVVDQHNTAGFVAGALVAVFTLHTVQEDGQNQSQGIAYSHDQGLTWTKSEGNPVIAMPAGRKDFRDPMVFWCGAAAASKQLWAMTASREGCLSTAGRAAA